MPLPPYIGEVISSSTTTFTAECARTTDADTTPRLPEPPEFGSFVRVGTASISLGNISKADFNESDDPFALPSPLGAGSLPKAVPEPVALYGVVVFAESGAREPGRVVTAYGLDEDELRRSQPQIYELLTSRFSAVLIGFADADGLMRPHLPPRPPRPHARVWPVTADETRRLTERLDFLRPLLLGGVGQVAFPADELVAAVLKRAYLSAHTHDEGFLLRAGSVLAALLPSEYDRLRTIIERIMS